MQQETAVASCPRCGGTGWATPADDPEGAVARCDCFREARSERLLEAANIPTRYRFCKLDNFETGFAGAEPALEGALLKCQRYIEDFLSHNHGLLFMGPVGVGKTHLAVGVLRALIERYRVRALFLDYRDMLRNIQESYNPVSETSELQVLRPALDADVLLLDEFGARRPTVWVQDTVTHIVNDRYNRSLPTLFTTNYQDGKASGEEKINLEERVGGRLRSRLYEMCDPVSLAGLDYRKILKSASFRAR